jgi:hypothetical protein
MQQCSLITHALAHDTLANKGISRPSSQFLVFKKKEQLC